MDLGCIDLGCISWSDEKQITADSSAEPRTGETSDSASVSAKFVKNKFPKGSPPSGVNALNRFTSQIKKPPHRKTSPLNWFPRKKVDSYLKRKIKLLQEAGGMNDTLDETLGHSNPHYCRVEREKIAAREAACKVMEARKAAMVEASWCRILQAARIPTKEADGLLLKAQKEVTEALEAATAKGVIMYDTPDRPCKHFEIETSSANGKGSTTHTVKASFETAFEVDKQVAVAVKTAFVRLAHCSSFNKDEFKDLLRKISENPESKDLSEFDTQSEFGTGVQDDDGGFSSQRKNKKKVNPQKFNGTKLVQMMLERLKCLKEEELASLATIVATCGLNAALAEIESCNRAYFEKQVEPDLPSLDKFLVKKMTKLEKEVQEARKNARKAESKQCNDDNVDVKPVSADYIPDLGSVLVKHSSKLEKEIEEAKRNQKILDLNEPKLEREQLKQENTEEVPSLDKFLVKHVSRLEREVQEAKNRRRDAVTVAGEQTEKENIDSNKSVSQVRNDEKETSLDKILVKPLHRLEREKMQAIDQGKESGKWGYRKHQRKTDYGEGESLDKVLLKHVSRLEKEKMGRKEEVLEVKKKKTAPLNLDTSSVGGLDQILVKHKSRLEREKSAVASQKAEDEGSTYSSSMSRREARERELLETWGGFSLGNSMQPRVSRLEQEKKPEDGSTYSSSMSRREARERELLETWGGISLANSMQPHVSRLEQEKATWLKAEEKEQKATVL